MDQHPFQNPQPQPPYQPFQVPYYPFYQPCLPGSDPSFADLQQKYQNLMIEHQILKKKCQELEKRLDKKRPIKRRKEAELERSYPCPYRFCKKEYASDFALCNHIRIKHNGGTKKERDKAASRILKCQLEGKRAPKQKIKVPPGYIQQNKVRLMLMESDEESKQIKTEK